METDGKTTVSMKKKSLAERLQAVKANTKVKADPALKPVIVRQIANDPIQRARDLLVVIRRLGTRKTAYIDYLDAIGSGNDIPSMTVGDALREFKELEKDFNKVSPVHTYVDTVLRTEHVKVTNASLCDINNNPLLHVSGSYGIGPEQVLTRDAANFIMMFTSKEVNSSEVAQVSKDAANQLEMPWVRFTEDRAALSSNKGNNMLERDSMLPRLAVSKCLTFKINSMVYSHPSMSNYVVKDEKVQAYYDKNRLSQHCPPQTMFVRNITSFQARKVTTVDKCWRVYQTSVSYRGGQKGKGEISAGYYRFDAPRAFLNLVDDVTDILSVAHSMGTHIVEYKTTPNPEIIRILNANKVSVVSPDGTGVLTKLAAKVGHFRKTAAKRIVLTAYTAKPPIVKDFIEYSDPPDVFTKNKNKIKMAWDYIRSTDSDAYFTFPSIKVEKGRCIRLSRSKGNYPDSSLISRFSQAIFTRNWYAFTRVPFVNLDPLRNLFVTWLYPKLVKEEEVAFEAAGEPPISYIPDVNPYIDSFLEAVPVTNPIRCAVDDELTRRLVDLVVREGEDFLLFLEMCYRHNCLGDLTEWDTNFDYILEVYAKSAIGETIYNLLKRAEVIVKEDFDYDKATLDYFDRFSGYITVGDEENDSENEGGALEIEESAPPQKSLFDDEGDAIFAQVGGQEVAKKRQNDSKK
jgi:hypothetical protein